MHPTQQLYRAQGKQHVAVSVEATLQADQDPWRYAPSEARLSRQRTGGGEDERASSAKETSKLRTILYD